MAVKDKKRYTFYLDEDNVNFIKSHIRTTKGTGGLSRLIDNYFSELVSSVEGYNKFHESLSIPLDVETFLGISKES